MQKIVAENINITFPEIVGFGSGNGRGGNGCIGVRDWRGGACDRRGGRGVGRLGGGRGRQGPLTNQVCGLKKCCYIKRYNIFFQKDKI